VDLEATGEGWRTRDREGQPHGLVEQCGHQAPWARPGAPSNAGPRVTRPTASSPSRCTSAAMPIGSSSRDERVGHEPLARRVVGVRRRITVEQQRDPVGEGVLAHRGGGTSAVSASTAARRRASSSPVMSRATSSCPSWRRAAAAPVRSSPVSGAVSTGRSFTVRTVTGPASHVAAKPEPPRQPSQRPPAARCTGHPQGALAKEVADALDALAAGELRASIDDVLPRCTRPRGVRPLGEARAAGRARARNRYHVSTRPCARAVGAADGKVRPRRCPCRRGPRRTRGTARP